MRSTANRFLLFGPGNSAPECQLKLKLYSMEADVGRSDTKMMKTQTFWEMKTESVENLVLLNAILSKPSTTRQEHWRRETITLGIESYNELPITYGRARRRNEQDLATLHSALESRGRRGNWLGHRVASKRKMG